MLEAIIEYSVSGWRGIADCRKLFRVSVCGPCIFHEWNTHALHRSRKPSGKKPKWKNTREYAIFGIVFFFFFFFSCCLHIELLRGDIISATSTSDGKQSASVISSCNVLLYIRLCARVHMICTVREIAMQRWRPQQQQQQQNTATNRIATISQSQGQTY